MKMFSAPIRRAAVSAAIGLAALMGGQPAAAQQSDCDATCPTPCYFGRCPAHENAEPPPRRNAPKRLTRYHYVGPVFPPDPWLALRTAPTTRQGRRLMKMPEGTLFRKLDQSGKWFKVELRDGRVGWAHSGWIKCCVQVPE